jgi:restriction system protein
MAIPDYQSIMLPVLKLANDGKEHSFRETVKRLADEFRLTEEERQQPLPSKTQPIFDNRVGWARTYLVKAGLLQSPRRGFFQITPRGIETLKIKPAGINAAYLRKNFQEFRDFATPKPDDSVPGDNTVTDTQTPEESLEAAYQNLRKAVESDLLARLKAGSPEFFERVVVQLLVAMGYGGSLRDAGKAIGRSGDEGIDGIIKEDRLGLDVVYVQAKKWENQVSRPEIQKFAGALQGQRARKGVFITTSTFSGEARSFAANIDSKIILIDGEQLVQFMFDHNVGVSPSSMYEVKKVDADFFEEG